MAFRDTVIQYAAHLATRPTPCFQEAMETRRVPGGDAASIDVALPNVIQTKTPEEARAQRKAFRRQTFINAASLEPQDLFKMSVLVRALRAGEGDVLRTAQHTRKEDRTALLAKAEDLLGGLALAEVQGIDLEGSWGF